MKFPAWSPAELQEAYDALKATAAEDWIRSDDIQLKMSLSKCSPSEYLRGIGKPSETLHVIVNLATDLRMKDVWSELAALEAMARAGKIRRTFIAEREIVSCGVAARCAYAIDKERESVTRASWIARHEEIARVASELSNLLRPSKSMDPGFQNIASMFTGTQFRDIAAELNMHTRMYGEAELREDPDRIESPEEIQENDKIWNKEVDELAYWVEVAMTRCPSAYSWDVLNRMVEVARNAAAHPPFVAPSAPIDRQIFNISGGLFSYFRFLFARPLDAIVATIASVVTDQDVSTDSVKMRRHRWRRSQQHKT